MTILLSLLLLQVAPHAMPYAVPGEDAVDPYQADEAHAGAAQFSGDAMARAFHGREGIGRIVGHMVTAAYDDPVIGEVFKGHDKVRLKRTLNEQFCYILNAGCTYSGRDMVRAHKDLGVQRKDMNRLVELLQQAMRHEKVDFAAQNRFLAKLAPMNHDITKK